MSGRTAERPGMWAVVPVKLFAETKSRLAPVLTREERKGLARAMLHDVLSALMHTPALDAVMVVTSEGEAAAIARDAGALVFPDAENAGISAAVASGARHLAGEGCGAMLVLPADVPSITHADIEAIIAAHRSAPSVTLVPASADGGTNALACSGPEVIPFCFGRDSFSGHCDAAIARGIQPQIVRLERVGRDIDTPDDLARFMGRPSPTRTYAYLAAQGIAQRLRVETVRQ